MRESHHKSSKLHKPLCDIIQFELNDIFVKNGWSNYKGSLASITDVLLSQDKKTCKIFISLLSTSLLDEFLNLLETHHSEIIMQINYKLKNKMRFVPQEYFFYPDTSGERASHISQLLDKISQEKLREPR